MGKPLVLLTGVGRAVGIAAGVARQLAADGWDLALNYWTPYDERMPWASLPSGFKGLTEELSRLGADIMRLPGNLELVTTPDALFKSISAAGRAVSALVLAHCESVDSTSSIRQSKASIGTTLSTFDQVGSSSASLLYKRRKRVGASWP